MEIDRIEHITRLNQWLEIIHGTPDVLSWPKDYDKEEAYELYKSFKNQPESSKREDLIEMIVPPEPDYLIKKRLKEDVKFIKNCAGINEDLLGCGTPNSIEI